jgi:hypothetical protein
VSIKSKFCKVIFCVTLGLASLAGTPMRPEEIEELMHQMNQPKIAHALPDENDNGEDQAKREPPDPAPSSGLPQPFPGVDPW